MGVLYFALQKEALLRSKTGCGTKLLGFVCLLPTLSPRHPPHFDNFCPLGARFSVAQEWSYPQYLRTNLHSLVIAVGLDHC